MKDRIGKALLLLASSLLAFAAMESFLRLAYPAPVRRYRSDPRTIYRLTPGAVWTFTHEPENGGHTVTTRINSRGFRGPELDEDADRRIVVYGDSFIQAEVSEENESFVARLQATLNDECPWRTEVVNAGVVGYGPDQMLLKMEEELPLIAPDLVVVAIFADNDFGDLLRNKIFSLTATGEIEQQEAKLDEAVARRLSPQRDLAWLRLMKKAYWRWLDTRRAGGRPGNKKEESRVGAWRIDRWLEESLAEYSVYVEEGDRIVHSIDYDHYDADMSLLPGSASACYKIRLMNSVFRRIATCLSSADVDPLVLVIPSPIDVCKDYDFDVDVTRYPAYDPRALTRAAEQAAAAAALPYLSLWQLFLDQDANSLYFHYGDNHWNDRGQALAAVAVARRIGELYWPQCDGRRPAP